ncbi:hypothetical protein B0J18DRAFT_59910 [Chaetomium sp. MPI-SDFR-AT-0129]|nr:hypothetical protein B0J18DRAFT_59910 [Chaetomium sp. MPI-SDFR-AT-0129]
MQSMRSAGAASVGARVLGEIEETTLDEVLAAFRTSFHAANNIAKGDHGDDNGVIGSRTSPKTRSPSFPVDALNDLVDRHFRATGSSTLTLAGRHLELLYFLLAILIATPHEKAVAIIDFEGRFDPLRLLTTSVASSRLFVDGSTTAETMPATTALRRSDLEHLHVLRPLRGSPVHVADCVTSIERYMLYGSHKSGRREWWGTIIIGGGAMSSAGVVSNAAVPQAQVAVTAGWKGWLRVEHAEVPTFWDASAEEALAHRHRRQTVVERAAWLATSPWGAFSVPSDHGVIDGRRNCQGETGSTLSSS